MFRSAIHAGNRARAETGISHKATSISSLAAALVAKEIEDLGASTVMMVGAGEMAELAVEAVIPRLIQADNWVEQVKYTVYRS